VDPDLPNTSMLFRGAATVLLDCGYRVPEALWRISRDPDLLDAIWISHRHADHCFGLPALLLWMRLQGRSRELAIISAAGNATGLQRVLDVGYPGAFTADKCFPLRFVEVADGDEARILGLEWRVARSQHGMPNHAVRIEDAGRSFCYSGDGRATAATEALFVGADLLVPAPGETVQI